MKDYELKCADKKQEFPTGAVRDVQDGKGRFDLTPSRAMRRIAIHFEKGAKKYSPNNYLKGIPLSRYMDSALRHIYSYMEGDTSEDHLVSAAWNLVAALETESRIDEKILPAELNDLHTLVYPTIV